MTIPDMDDAPRESPSVLTLLRGDEKVDLLILRVGDGPGIQLQVSDGSDRALVRLTPRDAARLGAELMMAADFCGPLPEDAT